MHALHRLIKNHCAVPETWLAVPSLHNTGALRCAGERSYLDLFQSTSTNCAAGSQCSEDGSMTLTSGTEQSKFLAKARQYEWWKGMIGRITWRVPWVVGYWPWSLRWEICKIATHIRHEAPWQWFCIWASDNLKNKGLASVGPAFSLSWICVRALCSLVWAWGLIFIFLESLTRNDCYPPSSRSLNSSYVYTNDWKPNKWRTKQTLYIYLT